MEQSRIDLSLYRLEQAKQCIASSRVLYDIGDYKGSANRSYYESSFGIRKNRFF